MRALVIIGGVFACVCAFYRYLGWIGTVEYSPWQLDQMQRQSEQFIHSVIKRGR